MDNSVALSINLTWDVYLKMKHVMESTQHYCFDFVATCQAGTPASHPAPFAWLLACCTNTCRKADINTANIIWVYGNMQLSLDHVTLTKYNALSINNVYNIELIQISTIYQIHRCIVTHKISTVSHPSQGPVLLLRYDAVARSLIIRGTAFIESCAAIGWNSCDSVRSL